MFLTFGIKDFIDILLVALLMFYCYQKMRRTRSMYLFVGVLVFIVLWLVISQLLGMRLMGTLMDRIVSVGAIALIVLFQADIRKAFFMLGTNDRMKWLRQLIFKTKVDKNAREDVMTIVKACKSMSRQKVGALIIIRNHMPLIEFERYGEVLDAKISQRLIENLFFKNSPLHDGAMVIGGGRIEAAGCVLPVSHNELPHELGLRHRAAVGMTEETDAMAIVVSEETGKISVARGGVIEVDVSADQLEQRILEL